MLIEKVVKPIICTKIYADNFTLPISVEEFVRWDNQTSGVALQQNALITDMIQTAREIVENYTWLDLTLKTYTAEYDFYPYFGGVMNNLKLMLPRSPIFGMNNITKIQYLDSTGIWNTFDPGTALGIDGLFKNVTMRQERVGQASLFFETAPNFDVTRTNAYKMQITFNTGYDYNVNDKVNLSYDNTSGLVTATTPFPHSFINNSNITILGAKQSDYDGTYTITFNLHIN
jgi:hypothetical protein